MKCEPENSRRGEALRSTLLFSLRSARGKCQKEFSKNVGKGQQDTRFQRFQRFQRSSEVDPPSQDITMCSLNLRPFALLNANETKQNGRVGRVYEYSTPA